MGYYEEVAADSPRLWHKFNASTVDNAGAATMGAVTSGGSGYVFDNSLFTKGIRMVDSTSYAQYNLPEDVFNGEWTIEAWFKISASKEYNNILRISPANGKHIGLRVRGSAHASQFRPNTVELFTYDGTSWGDVTHVSTKNVNDGEWHHVVVKSTGTGTLKNLSMHVDGVKYTTGIAPSTRAISGMTGGAMKIGAGPDAGGVEVWRDGVIDDIAIYNTALSDARIAAHYNATTSAYSAEVLADSPTNYWPMNNTSGVDVGSASKTLTVTGVTSTTGQVDNAWNFDGNDYATATLTAIGNTYTIETWVNLTQTTQGTNRIIQWSTPLVTFFIASEYPFPSYSKVGKPGYHISGSELFGTTRVDDGQWHHIVFVVSGTSASIYVDGVLEASGTVPDVSISAKAATIGCGAVGTPADYMKGKMDELAIYPTALSATRIEAHTIAGLGGLNAGYTAQPMTASADVVQPAVNHKTVFVLPVTEDAFVDSNNASTNFGNSDNLKVNAVFQTHSFLKVSGLPSGALDGKTLESATLTLTPVVPTTGVAAGAVVNVATVDAAWDEATITYTNMPTTTAAGTSPIGNVAADVPVNISVGSAALATNGFALITGTAKNFSFYSSGYSTATKRPYVTVVLTSPIPVDVPAGPMTASAATPPATVSGSTSVAYVAEPLTANAELMDATASTGANTHINVAPMYASVAMPNAVATAEQFIDLAIEAEPMDAYADFGQSGFAQPVNPSAEPMTAVGETVDASVDTQRGPKIKAQVMNASAVWKQPTAINGNPITASEVDDNYFQRIYPDAEAWWRLNDLGSTAVNRMNTSNGKTYYSVQVGQHNGPDGRHSVYFDGTASIGNLGGPGDYSTFGSTTLQFSLRTTKANQFLMFTSGGVDGTQDGPNELYLKDGRIEYRIYEGGTLTPVNHHSFTGFKRIDDGEWHTITIRGVEGDMGLENDGVEVYIDGIMDIRRRRIEGVTFPWGSGDLKWTVSPKWIGGRPEITSGGQQYLKMPALPSSLNFVGDMSEIAWFHEARSPHDIARDYYAFMGWTPIEPDNITATADMPQGTRGEGNQKRVLHLWWDYREDGYRLPGNQNKMNFNPVIGSKGNTGVYDFEGYKVFSKPVANMQVPFGASEYRDRVDDSDTLIDLEWDVDIRDYDVITFADWPDEGAEFDTWRAEIPNFQAKYERLLAQLRDANDLGIGLYVTHPRLAVELGIVDRVEMVPTLKEHYGSWMNALENIGFQGNAAGNYDYGSAVKFPWNITNDAGLEVSSGARGTGQEMNTDPEYLETKAFYYADMNFNNKFRVRALVDGLTNIPAYIVKDAVLHDDSDIWGDQLRALNYEDRRGGLNIGDEFIFHGTNMAELQYDEFMNDLGIMFTRPYGYYATPVANVKAGTIVTTFGASLWNNKNEVANPYKDYATTIVLDAGDTLGGRPVGGRIFVNFTEQPNRWYETLWADVLPGSEWDDGTAEWPFKYESDTDAQRDWEFSWTRVTAQSVAVKGKPVFVEVILPDGTAQSYRAGSNDPEKLFSVKYSPLFNTAYLPHWDMTRRGLWWVGRGETIAEGDVRVGGTAMTATASIAEPTVVAERSTVINTQPMVALAQMPRVAESTVGDVEVVTLPATATATFTGFSTVISAGPMEATATLVENFDMVHATGEQVVLTLHGVDATLYLKEEA